MKHFDQPTLEAKGYTYRDHSEEDCTGIWSKTVCDSQGKAQYTIVIKPYLFSDGYSKVTVHVQLRRDQYEFNLDFPSLPERTADLDDIEAFYRVAYRTLSCIPYG